MRYAELVACINEILGQYPFPLTVRQIHYRLVAGYRQPNVRSTSNTLSRQLVKARERGDVDETRIEDRSREFLGGDYGFDSPENFVKAIFDDMTPERYARKMWSNQPQFVIVWIEKDALSRVVSRITDQYRVLTAPSRGYASYSYIKDAIRRLPSDKPVVVLHFADHDPSGIDMTRDLERRFKRYLPYSFKSDLEVRRVALTHDQVLRYGLKPNPTKRADTRSGAYEAQYGNQCWELDAIEPNELQRIVNTTVETFIDVDKWNEAVKQTKKDRIQLRKMLDEMKKHLPFNC